MKHILVLGAGKSTSYLISHLLKEAQEQDWFVTVCDRAASERCPLFPGTPRKLHWSIPDPAAAVGPQEQVERAFDEALQLLRDRIERELL